MIKIYHNPRCGKSRAGLALLEQSGKVFEVISYLKTIPTEKELKEILSKLEIAPLALIRTNEAIWKDHYKGKKLTDEQLIKAMIEHPKLIERPIIIHENKAVIGRPTEKIHSIL